MNPTVEHAQCPTVGLMSSFAASGGGFDCRRGDGTMISGTVVSPENVDRSVNIPFARRTVVADKKLRVHEPRLHLIIRRSRFSDRPA